jgi:hypothetical protein
LDTVERIEAVIRTKLSLRTTTVTPA